MMRRTFPPPSDAGPAPTAAPAPAAPASSSPDAGAEPYELRTEFAFTLPRGYVDGSGRVHRDGVMRLATARDELVPLHDDRVRENPAYLTVVLLARVITRLGTVTDVHAGVVESLFAADLAFLQELYKRVNTEGHTRAQVTCPACQHEMTVDLAGAGGRLGGS
jgi:hypothetical protein